MAARPWTIEEESRMNDMVGLVGSLFAGEINWEMVAAHMGGGRTAEEVKERYSLVLQEINDAPTPSVSSDSNVSDLTSESGNGNSNGNGNGASNGYGWNGNRQGNVGHSSESKENGTANGGR